MDRYTEIQLDRILYELQKQTQLLEHLTSSNAEKDPEFDLPPIPEPPQDAETDDVQRRT